MYWVEINLKKNLAIYFLVYNWCIIAIWKKKYSPTNNQFSLIHSIHSILTLKIKTSRLKLKLTCYREESITRRRHHTNSKLFILPFNSTYKRLLKLLYIVLFSLKLINKRFTLYLEWKWYVLITCVAWFGELIIKQLVGNHPWMWMIWLRGFFKVKK